MYRSPVFHLSSALLASEYTTEQPVAIQGRPRTAPLWVKTPRWNTATQFRHGSPVTLRTCEEYKVHGKSACKNTCQKQYLRNFMSWLSSKTLSKCLLGNIMSRKCCIWEISLHIGIGLCTTKYPSHQLQHNQCRGTCHHYWNMCRESKGYQKRILGHRPASVPPVLFDSGNPGVKMKLMVINR